MTTWNTTHDNLLKAHAKPIAHMWRQIQEHRFGLVFGAGVSSDFDVPDWNTLLERIANDSEVHGADIVASQEKASASLLAQTLFQHFASRVLTNKRPAITRGEIKRLWRDVVRRQLYRKARKQDSTYLDTHPYIREFLPLIRQSPMTVTYNFDDFLERFLELERKREQAASGTAIGKAKPYEVIWRPDIHARRPSGVIYHPNGFLPDNEAEPASDGLVFCENEFADQLMESISGRYASLLHFLSRHTCLLIGLSLNDATLKHLLRQNAQLNPGHLHYYVHFEDKEKPTSDAVQKAIFEANFEVHNLITLFLTAPQIGALGYILNQEARELLSRAKAASTNMSYYYYVTGVPCAGKSSAIACLRSFTTYDEWLDSRLPDMSKRPPDLGRSREEAIDDWVATQFEQKNLMLDESPDRQIGIHVLDRCMLDPMSFKGKHQRAKRARTLLDKVCGVNRTESIQEGMVFYLEGEPKVIEERCRVAGKEFTNNDLANMQHILKRVYQGKHLRMFNTCRRSRAEVTKEMVRCIFTEDYKAMDIKRRLMRIETRRLKW